TAPSLTQGRPVGQTGSRKRRTAPDRAGPAPFVRSATDRRGDQSSISALSPVFAAAVHESSTVLSPSESASVSEAPSAPRPSAPVRSRRTSVLFSGTCTPRTFTGTWLSHAFTGTAMLLPATLSRPELDRKSTRLNFSHVKISYA